MTAAQRGHRPSALAFVECIQQRGHFTPSALRTSMRRPGKAVTAAGHVRGIGVVVRQDDIRNEQQGRQVHVLHGLEAPWQPPRRGRRGRHGPRAPCRCACPRGPVSSTPLTSPRRAMSVSQLGHGRRIECVGRHRACTISLRTTLRTSSPARCGMACQISSQVNGRIGANIRAMASTMRIQRGLGAAALRGRCGTRSRGGPSECPDRSWTAPQRRNR